MAISAERVLPATHPAYGNSNLDFYVRGKYHFSGKMGICEQRMMGAEWKA
jgi:hypothetical protein